MKKLLLGAAAAMAIAAPSIANAETSGNVEVSIGNTEYDGGGEFDQLNLGGAVQFDAMSGWAVQLDAHTSNNDFDSSTGSVSHVAVHANTNTGAWDFGGWVGLTSYYGTGGYNLGAETRTNFGNLSLQGSIGYTQLDAFTELDGWNYQASAAYFFTPNLAINANLARHDFESGASEFEITDLGVGAAYGFGNGFEVYGGYVSSEFENGANFETDTWNLGFRYHFNGGTLQDYTNDGASWTSARTISDALGRLD